jgi:predicted DNA-binding protein
MKLGVIMSKTVTLRLKEEVYEVLLEAAKAENRPLSNLIETAAMAKINEQQFADDAELAEILENRDVMERIKKGSRDARSRRGRFVE